MIYLDNASTTQPSPQVLARFNEISQKCYYNASSSHQGGILARKVLDDARKTLGDSLGVNYENIIFTSGGTESNNLAIFGSINPKTKRQIITSRLEHPSVLECFKHLESRGVDVCYLGYNKKHIKDGQIIEQLENSLNCDTQLVSIMHVNNETGSINDIHAIGKLIKDRCPNALFHVDAVASFGRLPINLDYVDMLSASAHKIHGPKGVGILYVRKGILNPLLKGGGQEKGMRSGTENTPAFAAFATAVRTLPTSISHVKNLKQILVDNLPHKTVVNSPQDSSPFILNVSFVGIPSEVMVNALSQNGVLASAGAACGSNKRAVNRVLWEMGLPHSKNAVRFSFSHLNKEEEIITASTIIHKLVKEI